MSGFEVAGIVLGAFPLAIEALKQYEVVKTQIRLWRRIQEEYIDCRDEIEFQKLYYENNIRNLLSSAAVDDDVAKELVADSSSRHWRDPSVTRLLGSELFEPYLKCVKHMARTMDQLNLELKTDADFVQEKLGNSPKSSKLASIRFQLWRVHFSSGEKARERKRLLEDLKSQNEKLQKLVEMGKTNQGQNATLPVVDFAICSFWKRARRLAIALDNAWNCNTCQAQHSTRLVLQHRKEGESDFNVLFTTSSPSQWRIRQTRISEDPKVSSQPIQPDPAAAATYQPENKRALPIRSALKTLSSVFKKKTISVSIATELTRVENREPRPSPITDLCLVLNNRNDMCYGYISDDESHYYLYQVSHQDTNNFHSSTLEEVLGRDRLKRKQRYRLSLTLASSLLQLLDTPWLSNSWAKSDIIFPGGIPGPNTDLSQPHVRGRFTDAEPQSDSNGAEDQSHPLDVLGIVLLELCFGQRLQDRLDPALSAPGHQLFAALEWQKEVEGETGSDYAQAVAWCLLGHRMTPLERLRQGLYQNVVKPLENVYEQIFS